MAWSIEDKKTETRKTTAGKVVEVRPSVKGSPAKVELNRDRDLASGMEVLELEFLLGVVETTKSDDKNDVMMRKFVFNELHRRQQLEAVDSKALKVYAVNDGNLYGKDIQCEAMKKLTERTVHKGKPVAGRED